MSITTGRDNDKEVAAKVGVSPSTIGRWKSGDIDPKPRQVVAFARAYSKSALAALVAAGYLDADDLDGEVTLTRATDLDEISTLQIVDELRHRLEVINDYTGWIESLATRTASPASLTAETLNVIRPGIAPSKVDGMIYIQAMGDNLVSRPGFGDNLLFTVDEQMDGLLPFPTRNVRGLVDDEREAAFESDLPHEEDTDDLYDE